MKTAVEKHERDLVKANMEPVVGCDLDGTLAEYHGTWGAPIGRPILPMLTKIYRLRAEGQKVVLFTARADEADQIPIIKAWLEPLGLGDMEITNKKSLNMLYFFDDRAVQIEANTGERADGRPL